MRTKIIKLYKFNELSDEAKENAIEQMRNSFEYFSQDENLDVLKWFEKIFPVTVKNWEYGGYRAPQITWEFTDEQEIMDLSGQRLATYLWNNYKNNLYKGKYYSISHYDGKNRPSYKTRHSKIILEENYPIGLYLGYEMLIPIFNFLKRPTNDNFWDIMNDCLYAWVFACNKDVKYFYSDENIAELLIINEYEFNEEGEPQ